MAKYTRNLSAGALGALLLCAAFGARAQDNVIGPPQLKDFQLQPRERIVTQPAPQPVPPPPAAARTAPQPADTGPGAATRPPLARTRPAAETPRPSAPIRSEPSPVSEPSPAPSFPLAPATSLPTVQDAQEEQQQPAPSAGEPGGFPWAYALPAAALALLGVAWFRRRRDAAAIVPSHEAAAAAGPPPELPRAPLPRPWLELELKAERASATPTETIVQFELTIANTGKGAARNLRLDVKMFNAGREQDKEIGAFFRSAGRDATKLSLPGIAPDTTGVIRGEVAMPREEMRAVKLDEKLLFIPVIAVNALYDWDDGRTGQTSKSYVVGRELAQPSEKMGAFRVDLGPRIWRTIGQRQHNIARRV